MVPKYLNSKYQVGNHGTRLVVCYGHEAGDTRHPGGEGNCVTEITINHIKTNQSNTLELSSSSPSSQSSRFQVGSSIWTEVFRCSPDIIFLISSIVIVVSILTLDPIREAVKLILIHCWNNLHWNCTPYIQQTTNYSWILVLYCYILV